MTANHPAAGPRRPQGQQATCKAPAASTTLRLHHPGLQPPLALHPLLTAHSSRCMQSRASYDLYSRSGELAGHWVARPKERVSSLNLLSAAKRSSLHAEWLGYVIAVLACLWSWQVARLPHWRCQRL